MRGSVRVLILVVFGFMIQSSAGFSSSLNEYENVFESGWNLFSIPLIISGQHSPPKSRLLPQRFLVGLPQPLNLLKWSILSLLII